MGTYDTGSKAENIAAEFLLKIGYIILHRNWRYSHKELDIVARDKNILVIVEVKSRYGINSESPSESVSINKQKHIVDATEAYIFKYDINTEIRFDIIGVTFHSDGYFIDHIIDAFVPGVNW